MSAIVASLFIALLATTTGSLILRKYGPRLKAKSQSFTFHELRDRLQLLAIDGKVDQRSSVYGFLEFSINLAIRNVGVMKLSDMMTVSGAIDRKTGEGARDIFSEIAASDEEVQKLASDLFIALYRMLICNDDITYLLAKSIYMVTDKLRGAMRKAAKSAMGGLFPQRSAAAREAVKYRQYGERLANAA